MVNFIVSLSLCEFYAIESATSVVQENYGWATYTKAAGSWCGSNLPFKKKKVADYIVV
jgi:hypothetical protein